MNISPAEQFLSGAKGKSRGNGGRKGECLAPRANWKGFLKVAELSCPVALYTAVSTSERIAFHTINRVTGNRVHRQFFDSETRKPVEKDDQVKGYEVAKGQYVVLEPEEVAAAVPQSDKTLSISAFVDQSAVDELFFDKPYYLMPSERRGGEAFALLREAMRRKRVAAVAQAILFRRVRNLMIAPYLNGFVATTLNFDYEVRSAQAAFDGTPKIKISGEMMSLAKHIIKTKLGNFDPTKFEDRYEAALANLVSAKAQGRRIDAPRTEPRSRVVSLMDALRKSAGPVKSGPAAKKSRTAAGKERAKTSRRKAG
jgi:DNA end-binding protein Ku